MKHHLFTRNRLAACMAIAFASSPLLADDAFTTALKSGKASVNERLRFEQVDDEAFAKKAKALTLRSRIGYETAPLFGFTALVEVEDIRVVGGVDNFQLPPPPAPSALGEAVIADPEMTEINRAQLRYRGIPKLDITLGRQRLVFDNQRFIGNVGFRQDEQTFDALSAVYNGVPDFIFSYSYVDKVNGIATANEDGTQGKTSVFDSDTSDNLFNISYNGFTWGKFIAYSYNLHTQNDTLDGPAALIDVNGGLRYLSNKTHGLRFDGAYILPTTASLRAIYRAEYAKHKVVQVEAFKDVEHDAYYGLGEAGIAYTFGQGAYTVIPLLGYEVLSSDEGTYGLQTPYATKHAFNGWADQFLLTPKEGLRDKYATVAFNLNNFGTNILMMYHDYTSDAESTTAKKSLDYGSETSLQLTKTVGANWIFGAKGSAYNAAEGDLAVTKKPDSRKFWMWAELNF